MTPSIPWMTLPDPGWRPSTAGWRLRCFPGGLNHLDDASERKMGGQKPRWPLGKPRGRSGKAKRARGSLDGRSGAQKTRSGRQQGRREAENGGGERKKRVGEHSTRVLWQAKSVGGTVHRAILLACC